jgi:hypothetical protein
MGAGGSKAVQYRTWWLHCRAHTCRHASARRDTGAAPAGQPGEARARVAGKDACCTGDAAPDLEARAAALSGCCSASCCCHTAMRSAATAARCRSSHPNQALRQPAHWDAAAAQRAGELTALGS